MGWTRVAKSVAGLLLAFRSRAGTAGMFQNPVRLHEAYFISMIRNSALASVFLASTPINKSKLAVLCDFQSAL